MADGNGPGNATLTQTFNEAAGPTAQTHTTTDAQAPAQDTSRQQETAVAPNPAIEHSAGEEHDSADPYAHLTEAERDELRAMLEEQRPDPKPERHHRPDDPELVRDVNAGVEAGREHTIKNLAPAPQAPKPEPENDHHVDPDFDDGFDFTM